MYDLDLTRFSGSLLEYGCWPLPCPYQSPYAAAKHLTRVLPKGRFRWRAVVHLGSPVDSACVGVSSCDTCRASFPHTAAALLALLPAEVQAAFGIDADASGATGDEDFLFTMSTSQTLRDAGRMRQGGQNVAEMIMEQAGAERFRVSQVFVEQARFWHNRLDGLVGDEAWKRTPEHLRLRRVEQRVDLLEFGAGRRFEVLPDDPHCALHWPSPSGTVLNEARMRVERRRFPANMAMLAATPLADVYKAADGTEFEVIKLDHCGSLGSDFGEKWSLTVINAARQVLWFSAEKSTDVKAALAFVKNRLDAERRKGRHIRALLAIDNRPHADMTASIQEMLEASGCEKVIQDEFHVVQRASEFLKMTHPSARSGEVRTAQVPSSDSRS